MSELSRHLKTTRRIAWELSAIGTTASTGCSARYLLSIAAALPAVLRTRSLAPADARMVDRHCQFRPFGTKVVLPGSLFGGAREIYARRVYFARPEFRIYPGDTVVDVGANQGVFTTLAACIARKVIVIEAQSGYFEAIRHNVALNHGSAQLVLEFGLVGASTGVFANATRLTTASHYEKEPPCLSMADVLRTHAVEHVDFLKIDIEGSEFSLLRGNIEWLAKVSKIVMEVHPEFGSPSELVAILEQAGFRTDLRDNDLIRTSNIPEEGGYLYAWRIPAA